MRETAFGPFKLDCTTGELFRNGKPVPLPPKATLVLIALVSSPGRLVSHEALYETAWNGTVVEFDQGLYTCIRQIRKALGDDANNPRYIETVPRRGYRFCHPLAKPWRKRVTPRLTLQVIASFLALFTAVQLLGPHTTPQPIPIDNIALAGFRIDGFEVSTGGIDHQLETSARKSLVARGVNPDGNDPSYVLTGTVIPADDGASISVSLVRLSDGETVWENAFNPFCPEVKEDPVRVIGYIVARIVVDRVERDSA